MNAVVRALFDDTAITGAQAAGLKDTSTAAMRAAVREWFELFFRREAGKGKDCLLYTSEEYATGEVKVLCEDGWCIEKNDARIRAALLNMVKGRQEDV